MKIEYGKKIAEGEAILVKINGLAHLIYLKQGIPVATSIIDLPGIKVLKEE